jgi:predicted type IV restriction endonuclease
MTYKIQQLNTNTINNITYTQLAVSFINEENINKQVTILVTDNKVQINVKLLNKDITLTEDDIHYLNYILDKYLLNYIL